VVPKIKLPRYIQLKYNTFHVVMEIPADIRAKFSGKRRFTKSLQTDKLATAERRKWVFVGKWKEAFAAARKGDDHLSKMQQFIAANSSEFPRTIKEADGSTWIETAEDFLLWGYVSDVGTEYDGDKTGDPAVWDAYKVVTGEWIKLSERIDAWKERKARIDQVAPKTLDQMVSDVEHLCRKFTYLHDVTSEAVVEWILSDQKSMATNNRRATSYRSFMSFLGDKNPLPKLFNNADIPKDQRKKSRSQRRQPFSNADVIKLYNSCADQTLKDLIALDAYTGCRIEELCDLLVEDVNLETGAFHIKAGKTDAAIRDAPLHPKVRPLMERLCKQSSDGYVLSGLSAANKYGKRSNGIGKKFGRLKSSLGYDGRYVFHSFRKTVITQLENARYHKNLVQRLVGQEIAEGDSMAFGRYSGGVTLDVLRDMVEKIDYEGLNVE